MLEIICEQFCVLVKGKAEMRCMGCLLGVGTHDVCRLSRKERVDLFFNEIMQNMNNETLKKMLTERRWSGTLPYNEKMYIEKEILLKNSSWVKKLKTRIVNYM